MNTALLTLAAGALLALPAGEPTEAVANKLPKSDLEVIHPAAKTLDAFKGRAILIEFFAHW